MKLSNPSPIALPATSGADSHSFCFGFDNSYARLPERFYSRLAPTPVAAPRLVKVNAELARNLGLDADAMASAAGVEVLAGNVVAEGSEPLAMAYAGHQFGHFVPQLGDGRANLLGEVTECGTTSNSKVRVRLRSRAAETAGRRSAQSCANTL